MEIFRIIETYPTYKVSNYGRIMNINTGRILKPKLNSMGIMIVNLSKDNKGKSFTVHKLVGDAFLTKPEDGKHYIIKHIDGNLENNYLSNLMYITASESRTITHANIKREKYIKKRNAQTLTIFFN
jgi:hypothetical protein